MDIIAESLSVQQFDVNTKMTVNGLDVFDYIQSKLSTGVEFIGGYSDIDLAPKKNGCIAIVGTKEYIYSETQNDWIQIGDETLYGQIVDYLDKAPEYLLSNDLTAYETYNSTLSSLSSDGYATKTYAVHNLSGVANVISMPLSSYESISATADAETLYVITED